MVPQAWKIVCGILFFSLIWPSWARDSQAPLFDDHQDLSPGATAVKQIAIIGMLRERLYKDGEGCPLIRV